MIKTKKPAAIKKETKVLGVVEPEVAAAPTEELDPVVLEALNAKKVKKGKVKEVDYIPEFERDEDFGE